MCVVTTTYVKCTHTRGNRVQECILVLVADRLACIPIAPAENAVGKIVGGLAMTAVGLITRAPRARAFAASPTPAPRSWADSNACGRTG